MEQKKIVQRLDEILAVLPADRLAVESEKRYGGLNALQQKLTLAIESLQQLKNDLGGNHD